MVIGYLNESSDPYLDNFQSDLILTARLSSHVSFVSTRCIFTELNHPLHFFMFFFFETLVDLPDSKLTSYAKRRQREEFEIERSGLRRRLRSSEGFEIETSALRRKRSSEEGSVASLGTSFGMYCRKFIIIDSSHFITHIAVCNKSIAPCSPSRNL